MPANLTKKLTLDQRLKAQALKEDNATEDKDLIKTYELNGLRIAKTDLNDNAVEVTISDPEVIQM